MLYTLYVVLIMIAFDLLHPTAGLCDIVCLPKKKIKKLMMKYVVIPQKLAVKIVVYT